jgi:double-stranded uracil-DNA glycosylase
MKCTSFPPIATDEATILILGSMPGATSLRRRQYYAHPRNLFWSFMQTFCGGDASLPYEKRVQGLKTHGIALWDVLMHCERGGSLDADIQSGTAVPNDLEGFLRVHPDIRTIFFNGQKAGACFRKLVWPNLPGSLQDRLVLKTLPSTSPANARQPEKAKREAWRRHVRAALG